MSLAEKAKGLTDEEIIAKLKSPHRPYDNDVAVQNEAILRLMAKTDPRDAPKKEKAKKD